MKGSSAGISVITKSTNRHVHLIERLQNRAERDRLGLFFVEGVRALARAVETRHQIESVIYVSQFFTHPHGRRLLDHLRRSGVAAHPISADLFQRLSRMDEPQWVGLTVRQRWTSLRDVEESRARCWVALESIRSPGNLGSIMRTGDAVGAAGVIAIGADVDPYDPAAVRASMGSIFHTALVRASPSELLSWVEREGVQLVATSPGARLDYRQPVYRFPLVLLMGAERRGLSAALLARSHLAVRLPMVGATDSLNVAVATGVMLYEVLGRHRDATGR